MVSSYMEERSAHLKLEALGRIRVALAGSPPNCFYILLEDIFRYKEVQQGTPSLSTPQATPLATAPLPTDPKAFLTTPDIGSGSETVGTHGPQASLPNPYAAGARAMKTMLIIVLSHLVITPQDKTLTWCALIFADI